MRERDEIWAAVEKEYEELSRDWTSYQFLVALTFQVKAQDEPQARRALTDHLLDEARSLAYNALLQKATPPGQKED